MADWTHLLGSSIVGGRCVRRGASLSLPAFEALFAIFKFPPPSPSVSQDSLRFSGVSTGLLGVFSAVVLISERIDKMLSGNYLHLFFGSNLRAATTRILGDSRVDSIRILHLY